MSSRLNDLMETFQYIYMYYEALYLSCGSCWEVKFQQLCLSAIHKQTVPISLFCAVGLYERFIFSSMGTISLFKFWGQEPIPQD